MLHVSGIKDIQWSSQSTCVKPANPVTYATSKTKTNFSNNSLNLTQHSQYFFPWQQERVCQKILRTSTSTTVGP